MIRQINIKSFLEYAENLPVIDVRSPGEFAYAHIPGACNLPLFDDEERALIGTIYKKKGQKEAILEGFDIAGRKTRSLAEKALKIARNNQVIIHCWRGGMRSESIGWLLEKAGLNCYLLKGGYKSYRQYIRKFFRKKFRFCVLGGMTGSGKTQILKLIREKGHQVIDLEDIARHKGSAFGGLGENIQNSNEQFENELFTSLYQMDISRHIWVEDESRNLGHNIIPPELFKTLSVSPVIVLDVNKEERIKKLVERYGSYPVEDLKNCLEKISKRIGGMNTSKAQEALDQGKPEIFAEQVLSYYDKSYSFALQRKEKNKVFYLNSNSFEPEKNAAAIIDFAVRNLHVITCTNTLV